MGDLIGIGALLGIPFAIFIWAIWRSEQRDRQRRGPGGPERKGSPPDRSHWGGMGRPGR